MTSAARSLIVAAITIIIMSCGDPKFDQYFVQGEKLYTTHCSNCHQANGKGLGRLYPPLDSSDYMTNNFDETLCLIKYGVSGEITVDGIVYDQPMPGVRTLSDLEIAEIATYIYNRGEHKRGLVAVTEVQRVMVRCDTRE